MSHTLEELKSNGLKENCYKILETVGLCFSDESVKPKGQDLPDYIVCRRNDELKILWGLIIMDREI